MDTSIRPSATQREKRTLSHEELQKAFRDVGLKVTNQRLIVYREIVEHCFHPAVEEVYERVRAYLPAISLNTVYRVLTSLVEKGLIRRVDNLTTRGLYDDNLEDHHHFICTRCGAIHDVYVRNANALDIANPFDDAINEISIRISGVCAACRTKADGQ